MDGDRIIKRALKLLDTRMRNSDALSSPQAVRDYLRLTLSDKEHEVFMCIFLDAQNRVLASEELFRGTLTQTSVYPREVVKAALKHNAAAVILAHRQKHGLGTDLRAGDVHEHGDAAAVILAHPHPSGVAEPSRADEALTQALKQALALVDVKVLDHFVIAAGSAVSFAERGLL